MIKRSLAFLLSALLALQSAAAGLPDLGESSSADLSPSEERRIGERVMREIRREEPSYLDDPETESYLNALGGQLVAAAPVSSSYQFFAISDPMINAFAMPGGYIGVHTALILTTESESELASVLAHEIAHVEQRHIARMASKQGQTNLAILASMLVAVLAARSNDQLAQAAVVGGQAASIQAQLGYTREFEREADRMGLQTLEAAGFDVRGMPGFFERLQRETRLYENNAPSYLRTHPLNAERIADLENRVAQMRYKQVVGSDDFALIQARLRVRSASAADALRRAQTRWDQANAHDAAQRYDLTYALMRAGKADAAQRTYAGFPAGANNALITALGADLAMARGDPAAAVTLLEPAAKRAAAAPFLLYRLADAHIAAGQAGQAIDTLRPAVLAQRDDFNLWMRLAKAYQSVGDVVESHRAQAEVYALQGLWMPAIEQLEIARRSGATDFYTQSAIDARMRELRVRADEERELKRGGA